MVSLGRSLPQPARFVVAGGAAAAINWLARVLLSTVMPFVPAVLLALAIGMGFGFTVYRRYVFLRTTRPLLAQLRDFLAVNIVSLVAIVAVALLLRSILLAIMRQNLAEAVAHAVAIAFGAVLNYAGHKTLAFKSGTLQA